MFALRPDLVPPVRPRLTPPQGSPLGGDVVIVNNVAAGADTTVTFNGVPARQVTATGLRELRVVTPPGTGEVLVAITNPGPAGPVVTSLNFRYTELIVSVVRPDDLLALSFELVNLTLTGDGGSLERRDPSADAFVVVHLPAQHIAEMDFDATAAPPGPPPVGAVLAGPSRLVFTVPTAIETLPLTLSTLLDWAALVPAAPAGAVGSPTEPPPLATSIELPYRMLLTPGGQPSWEHQSSAPRVGNDDAVEVWRTSASDPGLRLTWSPELAHPSDPGAVTFGHPTPSQRAQLAAQAPALDSAQLVLSPLGASIDFRAALADTGAVTAWRHVVADGRDTYIRLVTRGVLAPFGHGASIATVVERRLTSATDGTPVEALRVTKILVVTQAEVDYAELQNGHPVLPFRSVRIQTRTTPPISSSDAVVGPVTVPGGPYPFHLVAEDLSGAPIDLIMPLVFVPEGQLGAGADSLNQQYAQFGDAADLRGQTVAFVPTAPTAGFAPNDEPADDSAGASLPVTGMSFILAPSPTGAPFVPELATAVISPPGADAVAGAIGAGNLWSVKYHDAYRAAGFDPTSNVGQVFAQVIEPTVLGFAADRAGGLAAPALNVDGLSRSLGPVAQSADLAVGSFIPANCLPDGAQLLGGLKLADFLAPLTGTAFDPARLPALLRKPIPSGVQTSFSWSPQLARDPATVTVGPLVVDLTTATLKLTNVSSAYFDGRPPTSVVEGTLTSVTFTFLDAVSLFVDLLHFRAEVGQKTDLTTGKDLRIAFAGDLAFLNPLAAALPKDGFSDPPFLDVTPAGITAGYTLGLPAIGVGILSIENLSFTAALSLPFTAPMGLRLAFSEREHPFLVTVSLIGGGGFFAIDVGTDGIRQIEGSLELGANLSVDLLIVTANVHVLAGFYFAMNPQGTTFSAFLRIGGSVDLLGLISVSIDLYLALAYSSNHSEIVGTASLTLGIHVLFVTKTVTLSVEKHFAVPGAASGNSIRATTQPTPVAFDELMTVDDWRAYRGAFV